MDIFQQLSAPPHLQAFMTSLAIGLLIGLERERRSSAKAGLRTFALVALLGTLSGLLSEQAGSGWILAAGLLIGRRHDHRRLPQAAERRRRPGHHLGRRPPGLLLPRRRGLVRLRHAGRDAGHRHHRPALLQAELHGLSSQLTPKDLISILQFAVLSFVILPILPDRNYGPYEALNPHQAWLMVVLVSGVSLAGYAALRLAGPQHGAPMMGLLGGLVSSTATTVVFSRHAR
jgi:hypothetical protein